MLLQSLGRQEPLVQEPPAALAENNTGRFWSSALGSGCQHGALKPFKEGK